MKEFIVPVYVCIDATDPAAARQTVIDLLEEIEWDTPDMNAVCVGNTEEVKEGHS